MKKETVAVYIDGGNMYRRLKDLGIPQKSRYFDYSAFVDYLVGERGLVSKRYYVGTVKDFDGSQKSKEMVKSQQKFLSVLERERFEIKRGKIMYDDGQIREKGVDVKLSLDLVIGAVDCLYDTAVVVSSDTDLIPAIKYVRKVKNVSVEYVGFGTSPSIGLIKESKISRVFSNADLIKFQKEKLKLLG